MSAFASVALCEGCTHECAWRGYCVDKAKAEAADDHRPILVQAHELLRSIGINLDEVLEDAGKYRGLLD